jgi:hypothetical protein
MIEYGIEKRIKLRSGPEKIWQSDRVQVFALAQDSETPYVIIRKFGYKGDLEAEIWLEDVTAQVLIKQIQKALDILPSSK